MHTDSTSLKAPAVAGFQGRGAAEIDINNAFEVRRWTQHWNVSEEELRKVVAEVGTELSEVRIALGK